MKLFTFVSLLIITFALSITVQAEQVDESTGLIKTDGWETVRNNCIACHSTKLITQNHGARNRWLAMIEWMQATQGLQQFDADTQEIILSYLSVHYGPKEDARRSSLDPLLMPSNPYKKTLQPQNITPELK
ncbi:MAG: hypothetical protein GKR92_13420 [Gammaproteobacteria bacterium]|nr:MAG: hypothetical protein GKR92_00050 [Gammaproteobacteria bacterium]QMU62645.1 MAG: hypothetical protein GKR92_13420 [Gammaproteobacteria bacterium]